MTTAEIKAIPATYNGVQFRSRTEARWAVFFDALGVRWEYEHEGYQLPSGWYLPDFWLPEVNGGIFVEIKPEREPTEREVIVAKELAYATKKEVAMMFGSPMCEPRGAMMQGRVYAMCWIGDALPSVGEDGFRVDDNGVHVGPVDWHDEEPRVLAAVNVARTKRFW